MKNYLFLLSLFLLSLSICTNAQTRVVSTADTNTNAASSYINYNSVASKVKGFQATVIKVSGTVAGKVYLQGTIDGIAWVTLDSIALTDVATQTKVFPISSTSYNSYRAHFSTTGTQKSYLKFSVLRRSDE